MNEKDIRIKILERLEREEQSTAEFMANEFLATLHPDLGTVKRSVLDLIEDGYIKQSFPSDISAINTVERKGSDRFLDKNDIPPVRLFITLKGQQFLIESKNLKRTTWMIKHDWWVKIVYLIAGSLIAVAINKFATNAKESMNSAERQKVNSNYFDQEKLDTVKQ